MQIYFSCFSWISRFLVLLLFLAFQSCSGQGGGSSTEDTVGTVIDRPSTPSSLTFEIFPSFSQDNLVASLTEGSDQTSEEEWLTMFTNLWRQFLKGDIIAIVSDLEELQLLEQKMYENGLKLSGPYPQEIQVPKHFLFGALGFWDITINQEELDPALRFYFKNSKTGLIWASYYRKINENKGILFFFNPDSTQLKLGLRSLELVFDFTDETLHLMVLRTQNWEANELVSLYFIQQCDATNLICIGENLEAEEEQVNSHMHFRYYYNDNTKEVCFGAINNLGSVVKTFSFIENPQTGVLINTCQIPKPVWGDYIFTLQDLLFNDTVQAVYLDGASTTGWDEELTSEQIDSLTHPSN